MGNEDELLNVTMVYHFVSDCIANGERRWSMSFEFRTFGLNVLCYESWMMLTLIGALGGEWSEFVTLGESLSLKRVRRMTSPSLASLAEAHIPGKRRRFEMMREMISKSKCANHCRLTWMSYGRTPHSSIIVMTSPVEWRSRRSSTLIYFISHFRWCFWLC